VNTLHACARRAACYRQKWPCANISRETASRIENGDAAVAIGQIVRYLDVIAPGTDLARLYETQDTALALLESSEKRQRARKLSPKALAQYDF
jgi:hypothetical protein